MSASGGLARAETNSREVQRVEHVVARVVRDLVHAGKEAAVVGSEAKHLLAPPGAHGPGSEQVVLLVVVDGTALGGTGVLGGGRVQHLITEGRSRLQVAVYAQKLFSRRATSNAECRAAHLHLDTSISSEHGRIGGDGAVGIDFVSSVLPDDCEESMGSVRSST